MLTAVMMALLCANALGRKTSSIPEQDIQDRGILGNVGEWAGAVRDLVDPIKGQLDNVDKAIDVATKARDFITGMKSAHAVIINLSKKEGTWYTYNDIAPFKWWTPYQSYMGAYTVISVHSLGWGAMTCKLNNKKPHFTVQRNHVYVFDGKNLSRWLNKSKL